MRDYSKEARQRYGYHEPPVVVDKMEKALEADVKEALGADHPLVKIVLDHFDLMSGYLIDRCDGAY